MQRRKLFYSLFCPARRKREFRQQSLLLFFQLFTRRRQIRRRRRHSLIASLSLVTVRKTLLFLLPLCEVPSSSLSPGFFVRPVFCRRRRRNFASSAFPLSLFPKTLCVYNVESEKSGPNCDMKKKERRANKGRGELRPIVVCADRQRRYTISLS